MRLLTDEEVELLINKPKFADAFDYLVFYNPFFPKSRPHWKVGFWMLYESPNLYDKKHE